MLKTMIATTSFALAVCTAVPAFAEGIDSLRGQFTFNWHANIDKQPCAVIDDQLLATFKSDVFHCNLDIITNTASAEPARVCTQTGDEAEYLIFQTQKSCEMERQTQLSNSEN